MAITLGSPSTFTSGAITFNYTVVATGGVTGFTTPVTGLPKDHVITDILHNPTDSPQTVTYTIVPVSPAGCAAGPVKVVVITVNPTPQVYPSPLTQTLCNDGITGITLGSTSTFTSGVITFNYTVVSTGGVTGFTTPVTGLPMDHVIADVLHNPTDSPQTVTYTIVPISPTGCTAGPAKVVVVTINPTPQVTLTPLAPTLCNDGTTDITLGSPSTFTSGSITFNYTVVATGGVTGFTTPVTGLPKDHLIADVLHNPTDSPQTVTYTIVPISPTGCAAGPVKVVVITVVPTPQVYPAPLTQTLCNDDTTGITLSSPSTFSSGVITFNYTVVATGGVTGFMSPVAGLPKDHIITDVLHNPSDSPQTVTYTIVPISPNGCAAGPAKEVVITVEPTPQVNPDPMVQNLCNDATTAITLGSLSTFTSGIITFNYTVVATGGVTGFSTPVTGLLKDHIIADVLHNPTDSPQTVSYTIIPISPTGCAAGPAKVVVVTVDPTPQVFPTPLTLTICNDGIMNIALSSPSTFANGDITFNYTVVATGGVTGFITPVTGLPRDHVIADVLHNPTDSPQTVTYTIVPVSPSGCAAGPVKIVVITVNPTPQVYPTPLTQTLCNDGITNIALGSLSAFTSGVITFNYTVVSTGGVTGYATPVTGIPMDHIIADVLHNPTDSPQTVTYTIVPISPTGCTAGPSKEVVITVNPTPQVTPTPLTQTICNDGTTGITLGSPSTFTSGVITFNYTVVATGGVTGFTTPVTGVLKDHVIADVLHNPTDSPQTVTYTIIPISPNGCASGPARVVVITVDPTPQVYPAPITQTICNDGTTGISLTSPSVFTNGNITFNYTVVATGGVTGFTTPVTGLLKDHLIADVLHNPTDSPQTVTYTIVPISPNGCAAGPAGVVVITVEPTPQVNPTPLSQTLCNDTPTGITLGSPSTFTSGFITFNYTVVATGGVTGFSTPVTGLPKDHVIADILHNPTDSPQTVTYTIVPISPTGCPAGPAKVVVITVNPTPQVNPTPLTQILCNDGTTDITLASTSTFTSGVITFSYTVAATGGVTGFTTPVTDLQVNHVINDVLHNPTDSPQTVTYSIVPISPAGCASGPSSDVIVTINPTPRIFPVPVSYIQCDSLLSSISLQSPSTFTSGLITFKYEAVASGGAGDLTGFFPSGTGLPNNSPIAQLLINHTDSPKDVTYTITPVSGAGCSDGASIAVTVTVNPTPRVIALNTNLKRDSSICYGGSTQVILTSPTVMTSGSIRFDYTVSFTGSGVVTGNSDPQTDRIPGYTISSPYQNNSDTLQSVFYHVTPKVDNNICVPGKIVNSEVKVHARPLQNMIIVKPLTCDGGSDAAIRAVPSKGAGQYYFDWIRTSTDQYHGYGITDLVNVKGGRWDVKVTDNLGCTYSDFRFVEGAFLDSYMYVVDTSGYGTTCSGSNDGEIWIYEKDASTGIPPFEYWIVRNSQDTVIHGSLPVIGLPQQKWYGLMPGNYTLYIRDSHGCYNLNYPEAVITEPAPVDVRLNSLINSVGYNISCKGYNDGSVWIDGLPTGGNGGYTYLWSTTDGTITGSNTLDRLDNITAGTYYLRTTDRKGCFSLDSIKITEPDGMTLDGSEVSHGNDGIFNISCNGGSDGYIKLTITGGSGNYTYSWTGPGPFVSSVRDISGLKAGTYICTVRDVNGCILTPLPQYPLTEPPPLLVTSASSLSGDGSFNINCYGGTGSVDISVTGGIVGTYQYSWSTTNGSGIIAGQQDQPSLTAGTYRLKVTDINSCENTIDIILTQPEPIGINFAVTDITCQSPAFDNGSIDLTVSGGVSSYTFQWSNGMITEDISGLTEGYYKVTVTDLNLCTKTDSVRVNLPAPLTYSKTVSAYTGYAISCKGLADGSVSIDPLTGEPPYVYSWTGPDGFTASTKDITGLKAGEYVMILTDNNFCTATETFILNEPEAIGMEISLSSSLEGDFNINCAGAFSGTIGIVPLNAVGVVDYLWSDGLFGNTRTGLAAGDYRIIISDGNNCHADTTVTLTEPDSIKLNFQITQPYCPAMPEGQIVLNVTGGVRGTDYTYSWSDNSSSSSLTNIPAGRYSVTVSDLNGCTVTTSMKVEPLNETCLDIPNAISPNGDLINDDWKIGLIELYPNVEITIFNRWGETIWKSAKGYPIPWDGRSDGRNLPVDSYHYIIDLHDGSKLIIGNVTVVR
ncbi:MAG: gliding motility-associated C-terminal domain-containing protein [Bacteroidales bacterium]|nr:gliding motility-associated C-terminal domain-containing protein [Bacteroidales bacterium]